MIKVRNVEEIKSHLDEVFNDEAKMRVFRSRIILLAVIGTAAVKALTPVNTGDLGGRIR